MKLLLFVLSLLTCNFTMLPVKSETSVQRPTTLAIWPGDKNYWEKSEMLGAWVQNQIVFMDLRAMSFPLLKTYLDQGLGVQLVVEAWENYACLWSLANGSRDKELTDFFTKVKQDGRHVTVRILHEFNGVWYPWCIYGQGSNSKEAYFAAFRHMVGVIKATGANVSIQQAYNSISVGGTDSMESLYIGDQYCDEVTVSTYNFCGAHGTNIEYIDGLINQWYTAMSHTNSKRLGISEIGTTSHCGVDKVAWIKDAFQKLAYNYPRIQTVCWFFENKSNNEDLDVNTWQEANAFRDGYYMWHAATGVAAGDESIIVPPAIADQEQLTTSLTDYENSLKQKGFTKPGNVDKSSISKAPDFSMALTP